MKFCKVSNELPDLVPEIEYLSARETEISQDIQRIEARMMRHLDWMIDARSRVQRARAQECYRSCMDEVARLESALNELITGVKNA